MSSVIGFRACWERELQTQRDLLVEIEKALEDERSLERAWYAVGRSDKAEDHFEVYIRTQKVLAQTQKSIRDLEEKLRSNPVF